MTPQSRYIEENKYYQKGGLLFYERKPLDDNGNMYFTVKSVLFLKKLFTQNNKQFINSIFYPHLSVGFSWYINSSQFLSIGIYSPDDVMMFLDQFAEVDMQNQSRRNYTSKYYHNDVSIDCIIQVLFVKVNSVYTIEMAAYDSSSRQLLRKESIDLSINKFRFLKIMVYKFVESIPLATIQYQLSLLQPVDTNNNLQESAPQTLTQTLDSQILDSNLYGTPQIQESQRPPQDLPEQDSILPKSLIESLKSVTTQSEPNTDISNHSVETLVQENLVSEDAATKFKNLIQEETTTQEETDTNEQISVLQSQYHYSDNFLKVLQQLPHKVFECNGAQVVIFNDRQLVNSKAKEYLQTFAEIRKFEKDPQLSALIILQSDLNEILKDPLAKLGFFLFAITYLKLEFISMDYQVLQSGNSEDILKYIDSRISDEFVNSIILGRDQLLATTSCENNTFVEKYLNILQM